MTRIACVMMQRNEDLCLHPWAMWHGHLFGFENLFILDHGSDDRSVLETLLRLDRLGVRVTRLPEEADYRRKGDFVTAALHAAEQAAAYDVLLPLDCDEFVVMRDAAGGPNAVREDILDYFGTLQGGVLEVRENFLNVLGHRDLFFALPYRKVFFRHGNIHPLDHGSHHCLDASPGTPTRLVYVHFHHKGFTRQVQTSLDKLRPYVDITDRAALEAFRGTGWHLVTHVLKTEEEYLAIMRPDARCIAFPALIAMFEQLGIDPEFCEG